MMVFNWEWLLAAGLGYLFLLFLTAYLAEKDWMPKALLKHPLVYILSIGVYCSAWAFYGSVGMAYEFGYGYLAYYVGVSIALLFSAVILRPVLDLARSYQLASLADLFAFRYRSRWAGLLTTVGVLLAMLPLLALQIQAITDAITLLDPNTRAWLVALLICAILLLFSVLFGARDVAPTEQHPGLIFALAFESLFKLVALLILGGAALIEVFGGWPELNQLTIPLPEHLTEATPDLMPVQWFSLLLMFLSAPLVLPHLFQLLFRENTELPRLRLASWAVPIYLLLMALPVMPILWAGLSLGSTVPPEYFSLGLGMALNKPWMVWLAFLGGLSAAAGITVLASIALASMGLNHLVLPFYKPRFDADVYRWLLWVRRVLIGVVIGLSYCLYLFLNQVQNLSSLGITAFTGLLQLLPGILGLLFWSGANRKGYIAGFLVGLGVWATSLLIPMLADSFKLGYRLPLQFALNRDQWSMTTLLSLGLNTLVFILVSVFTRTSREEQEAAQTCVITSVDRRHRLPLKARNAGEFIEALSRPLGRIMAEREVKRALKSLGFPVGEYRPYALRRLRDTIEANLSGLMGPSVAQALVQRYLPYDRQESIDRDDIHFFEQRLDGYHHQLTGMAAELDRLRRHHRETLYNLPIGVCSLASDGEILLWNRVMAEMTGISEEEAIGARLDSLPANWYDLLDSFLKGTSNKMTVEQPNTEGHGKRWFSLHRNQQPVRGETPAEGHVILLEDETEHKMLESELVHSERLASIGRLAAGVAHEIGNPITGIDCLAQDLKYVSAPNEQQEIADQIREQTNRVTKIVRSLVNFAHAGQEDGKNDHQPWPLRQVVQDAIDLLSLSRNANPVIFVNDVGEDLVLLCEPQRLSQVFINLLGNARDASPANEIVRIKATAEGESALVEVIDRGSGINPADIDHIFDPFFTTKEVGKGTGLGLFLAYTIVEEHYGHITVESPAFTQEGIGTRFLIRLPLHTLLPEVTS
ncbi:sensor histidine kinase [Saccharospirillum salsuginis]|uniref:histidine kinase n=1 Tax=Saccharospirillum salsuginis TaxID=418750 RepID=A0A918K597_9GAMM|nr:sensor histidine kinase [Saccharospirillum salsuginis]GGX45693.1 two-component sensor CbrA [Saccharospirillum salsuginis]